MKRLLFTFLLLFISLSLYPQKTTRDSLQQILKQTTDANQRMKLLTNLTDISRDESQPAYAKLLLKEAEKDRSSYYKEVAYTEILRYYTNHDVPDSVKLYLNKADRALANSSYKQALLGFIRTMNEVRTVFYTNSSEKKKILEREYYRLETDHNMSPIDRLSANYIIGMALTKEPILELEGKKIQDVRGYFQRAVAIGEKMPIRAGSLFLPNILFMAINTALAQPTVQTHYAQEYYKIVTDWYNSPDMQQRPYYTKRHLINATSAMAMTGAVIGKAEAEKYFNEFVKLNKLYPEDANVTQQYEYYYTAINYYSGSGDYDKELPLLDKMIRFLETTTYKNDRIIYVKEKIDILKKQGHYKEALENYEVYSALLDSNRVVEMNAKIESLGIQKNVNKLINEKKALAVKSANRKTINYVLGICFALSVAIFLFVFFRLLRQRSLGKALKESNRRLREANEKVEESEEMKTSFIRNMSHEVRTPLNAINGFSELVTDEDITAEDRNNFSKIIHDNCFQLTTILDELLEVAQLDSSKQEIPFSPVNLYDVCSAELANLMKFDKKENVVYSVKGDTENALIETNKPYLGIVLNQLLMNAGKFTNEGFITIGYTIDKNNAQAEIYVADSGSGIPSEKRDWVFEKIHERERIQERYRHRTLPLPTDRHPS
jgi:signal transduction histidine kinase